MADNKLETRLQGYDRLKRGIEDRGVHAEVEIASQKKVIAWRLKQAMDQQKISKTEMCNRMGTTRPQLDRVLDENEKNITLRTLVRAAEALGKRVSLEIL